MKKFLVAILAALTLAAPVIALSEADLDKLDAINAPYYKLTSCESTVAAGVGSFDGTSSAGVSDLQAAFIDQYHDIAEKLSIEYGIPWEAVIAQGILESASGTSHYARTRNNFFGIGAFDSNPDNAHSYATPADGWRGYYENIRVTATYRNHGAFNHPGDPYGYIQAVKAAGYATDPNYVAKVSSIIAGVENRAKEKGWASSAELVAAHPEMAAAAAANQAGAGAAHPGASTASSSATAEICDPETSNTSSSSSGVAVQGNGNVNATAITLSWPELGHDPFNDPKPEYRSALAAVGLNRYGEVCVEHGNSCDAFVATVVRYSGADPNMVCCGPGNMLNYMASHPEIYQEIPNIGSTANMQGGDIRVNGQHIEIYVTLPNGQGRIASASHCDRTADHAGNYYVDSSYRIFRVKGGGNVY